MARRTVKESELVQLADDMKQFCDVMAHRLDKVADELRQLDETWEGVAFDAFLERLHYWQTWATEMGEVVGGMQRNAHIAHHNYLHNAQVNTAMWTG
jgi:uncharacterized protein YukE